MIEDIFTGTEGLGLNFWEGVTVETLQEALAIQDGETLDDVCNRLKRSMSLNLKDIQENRLNIE